MTICREPSPPPPLDPPPTRQVATGQGLVASAARIKTTLPHSMLGGGRGGDILSAALWGELRLLLSVVQFIIVRSALRCNITLILPEPVKREKVQLLSTNSFCRISHTIIHWMKLSYHGLNCALEFLAEMVGNVVILYLGISRVRLTSRHSGDRWDKNWAEILENTSQCSTGKTWSSEGLNIICQQFKTKH